MQEQQPSHLIAKMIPMGRISAPYGIKGWVKVRPYTEQINGLLDYSTWWIESGHDWQPYPVLESSVHGQYVVAHFDGCADRAVAESFKGRLIAIPREQMPKAGADEYYWTDLIGLEVINTQAQALGRIEKILETGANPVLVTRGDRERLIPFVNAVICEVNLASGSIRVEWDADY